MPSIFLCLTRAKPQDTFFTAEDSVRRPFITPPTPELSSNVFFFTTFSAPPSRQASKPPELTSWGKRISFASAGPNADKVAPLTEMPMPCKVNQTREPRPKHRREPLYTPTPHPGLEQAKG